MKNELRRTTIVTMGQNVRRRLIYLEVPEGLAPLITSFWEGPESPEEQKKVPLLFHSETKVEPGVKVNIHQSDVYNHKSYDVDLNERLFWLNWHKKECDFFHILTC